MARQSRSLKPDPRVNKSKPRISHKPLPVQEALKKIETIPEVPTDLPPPTQGNCGGASMGHHKHRQAPRGGSRRKY
jgi:hypothetical protein